MFCRFSSGSRSPWRSRSRSRRGTLAHGRASTMRVDHPNSESREAMEREFRELVRRQDKLMKANIKITKKVNMLGDKIEHTIGVLKGFKRADALPTALFPFVHRLEKAFMYFQFKKKAKQRYISEHYPHLSDFRDILRRDKELMSDFSNMGDSDIVHAVNQLNWEHISTKHNDPVLMVWIYGRVYDALQGDYVMDKDPEVELKKMMESDPDEYDSYFLEQPANYKKMSKQEAYKKYSELVSIINTVSKEALEEKQKSTKKRKSTPATSARNKKRMV